MDLHPLYSSVADGTLEEHLLAHPELVSPEVVALCREDTAGAARAGRPDVSWVAAMAAAVIQLRLGDRPGALNSRVDASQARFMMTDTPEGYAEVRDEALQLADLGRTIGADGQVFRCLTLAADCSFFAAELPATDDDVTFLQALDDVALATEAADGLTDDPEQQHWLARLASLLIAVLERSWGRFWGDAQGERVDAAMRRIAAGAENLPLDLDFEGFGGEAKAATAAASLAELEARYGSGS